MRVQAARCRCLLLVAGLLLCPVSASAANGDTTLVVDVTGAGGKCLRALDVQIERASAAPLNFETHRAREPISARVVIDSSGFKTTVTEPGVYWVWVHAPEHESTALPLLATGRAAVLHAKVQLAAAGPPELAGPPVVHFSGDGRAPVQMVLESGRWTAHFSSADDVLYGLQLGSASNGELVANPSEPKVKATRFGFRSVGTSVDGEVRIEFDPALLPDRTTESSATVVFPDNMAHEQLYRLTARYRRNNSDYIRLQRAHGPAAELASRRLEDARWFLNADGSQPESELVHHARLIFAVTTSWLLEPDVKERIRREVPPDCPLWALILPVYDGGLSVLLGSEDDTVKYVEAMAARSPDRRVRAEARYFLARRIGRSGDSDGEQKALQRLLSEFPDVAELRDRVRPRTARFEPGSVLPALAFTAIDGTQLSETAGAGQFTLLEFSAEWCGACVEAIPQLQELRRRYPQGQLRMITATVGKDVDGLRMLLARQPPQPWHHVAIPESEQERVLETFDVSHFPAMYLLSDRGQVVATDRELRRGDLLKNMQTLLGPPAAAP